MGENAEDGVGGEAAAQLEQTGGGEQEAPHRRDGEVEREQAPSPTPSRALCASALPK